MKYQYVCKECNDITEIELSMKDTLPKEIDCLTCKKGKMVYDWSAKPSIIIPQNFKAVNEEYRPKYGKKADNEARYY
jgi:hypothetical protein